MYKTISLVHISKKYIEYLHTYDKRVQYNYNQEDRRTKPYVGVLFKIKDREYYAPLTSNSNEKRSKQKLEKYKNNRITIHTIKDIVNGKEVILSAVCLNNMIPVIPGLYKEIDIENIEGYFYKNLLLKEIQYLKETANQLENKAKELYKLVTVYKADRFKEICCDFKLLEKALDKYLKEKDLQ